MGRGRVERRRGWLCRAYDAMLPPGPEGYSEEQDRRHEAGMFVAVLTLVAVAVASVWTIAASDAAMREGTITVPASTFSPDQAPDVIASLGEQGFVDGRHVPGVGVQAHGTRAMADAWRESFRDKHVRAAEDAMVPGELAAWGVLGVGHSDDWSQITIATASSEATADAVGHALDSDPAVRRLVNAYLDWSVVTGDGRVPHVTLLGRDGKEYHSADARSVAELVSLMQGGMPAGDATGGGAATDGDAGGTDDAPDVPDASEETDATDAATAAGDSSL